MYRVTTAVHVHFSHHVRGHSGPCISLHGHTWKFELTLESSELDQEGFVVDFDLVHARVLNPCHQLLDHSLAVGERTFAEIRGVLTEMGGVLVASRRETMGHTGDLPFHAVSPLAGARNELPGGIKVTVFPFTPTSERIAEWFHHLAEGTLSTERVSVASTRVYESLHPVEAFAEYLPRK